MDIHQMVEGLELDKNGCEEVVGAIPSDVSIPSEISTGAKKKILLKKKK